MSEGKYLTLNVDHLRELFDVCGITSSGILEGMTGVDRETAQRIFETVKEGMRLRVKKKTLDKLCEALTAYPEELLDNKYCYGTEREKRGRV